MDMIASLPRNAVGKMMQATSAGLRHGSLVVTLEASSARFPNLCGMDATGSLPRTAMDELMQAALVGSPRRNLAIAPDAP